MDDEFAKVDEARCNECASCVDACPTQAIKIEKK